MNIAERIKAKQERFVAVKDRMTEIKCLLEADDEYELSDDEQSELEALSDEQETLVKSIESLEKIEAGLASKVQPVTAASASAVSHTARAAEEKGGSLLIKNIAVAVIAHMTDTPQAEVMEQMYGGDERVKAVSKSYGTTMTVW